MFCELILILAAGCASPAPSPTPAPAPAAPTENTPAPAEARALAAAHTAIADRRDLHGQMIRGMGARAPSSDEVAGSQEADELKGATPPPDAAADAADAAPADPVPPGEATPGPRVGRTSLRLRDPANRAPPWVETWLAAQGEGSASGVSGVSHIEAGHARVIVPIVVEPPCLRCHGPADDIDPSIRAQIAAQYPDDAATGYAVGELRGAMWAEVPVEGARAN